jgi:hypothetical protein
MAPAPEIVTRPPEPRQRIPVGSRIYHLTRRSFRRTEGRQRSDGEAPRPSGRIIAKLSAEKPFINVSSLAELLLYLESAASTLKRSLRPSPQDRGINLWTKIALNYRWR